MVVPGAKRRRARPVVHDDGIDHDSPGGAINRLGHIRFLLRHTEAGKTTHRVAHRTAHRTTHRTTHRTAQRGTQRCSAQRIAVGLLRLRLNDVSDLLSLADHEVVAVPAAQREPGDLHGNRFVHLPNTVREEIQPVHNLDRFRDGGEVTPEDNLVLQGFILLAHLICPGQRVEHTQPDPIPVGFGWLDGIIVSPEHQRFAQLRKIRHPGKTKFIEFDVNLIHRRLSQSGFLIGCT